MCKNVRNYWIASDKNFQPAETAPSAQSLQKKIENYVCILKFHDLLKNYQLELQQQDLYGIHDKIQNSE